MLPLECDHCGGIVDYGDFGPDPNDGTVGVTCECECTCERQRINRLAGPVWEVLLDEECVFHGEDADPETWAAWRASFELSD
jgi:hypothetical protein